MAIVGGSGAGKSTLLDAIAGVHPADEGAVLYNGVDLYGNIGAFRSRLGYVPQEDIIHRELPLELTLRYAARLRLPAGTSREEIDASVAHTMDALDLTERAELRVGSLSGGQRKLSASGGAAHHAEVFFLEEPTSGLDPATESDMMRLLRRLADSGSTVILTTHAPEKIGICDKVVFLARGHLAFFGRPRRPPSTSWSTPSPRSTSGWVRKPRPRSGGTGSKHPGRTGRSAMLPGPRPQGTNGPLRSPVRLGRWGNGRCLPAGTSTSWCAIG